ncbi:exosortase/archaeosortase family protein [Rubellicoccus peritrichatus]|uniref:Exosortase/archaeosortase family protein n=1 Tax=Rubellicoccus peritrichatus TaxID=3080537 RepID=A0AAQ3QTI4_9BACT|nr:exosortase/archaeosortase family protein [Puniceicoccus sp. CR14]WOO39423.1 exosortase/archaeosortase family protein [Puniceicoccus sp. CR14]
MSSNSSQIDPWTKASGLLILLLAAFVCYDQYYYWSTQEDYSFGFIVPLFVAYVLHERWPIIKNYLLGLGKSKAESKGGLLTSGISFIVALGLIFSFLVMITGGAMRVAQGPANLASLMIAVGFGGAFMGIAYINSGEDATGRHPPLKERLGFTFIFLFPALVWLISAPMVMYLDSDVKLILMEWVSIIVFNVFDFLGLSIVREGNTLMLPKGVVGVADACSGVRSLTGCIFAGSFLAAVFLDKFWKKFLLIATAMLLAFLTNIMRSLFLTGTAYAKGSEALDEKIFTFVGGGITLHDFTGYAVLGVTCILLIMLLPIFNFTIAPPDGDDDEEYPLADPEPES